GKPDKKIYSLTAAGGAELDRLLAQAAGPTKVRDPLLVKLFAGRRLSPEALRVEIETHQKEHEQTLATYRMLQETIAALPAKRRARYRHPELTLRLGIRFEEAWLAWCEGAGADRGLSACGPPSQPRTSPSGGMNEPWRAAPAADAC
ncbi:MAG: hypothetical protein K0S16_2395, partial [Moraxellaceae bacterium]|nr:hypothetical protein [Moraxellaceae bacterium]